MSIITNSAYIAVKRISELERKLCNLECGEIGIAPEDFAQTIIKLAVVLVIGVVIIESVVTNTGMNDSSQPFYSLMQSVNTNITSGYALGSLMVLAAGASAILYYLGFI